MIARLSVRWRITFVAAGLFAVALGAASFVLVRTVHANLVDEIRATDQEQLTALAAQLARGVPGPQVRLNNPGPRGYPQIRAVGPQGEVDLPADNLRRGLTPGERLVLTTTVESPDGRITLVAQRSLAEVDQTVDNVTSVLYWGVPTLVLLVGVLAWYLVGRALRPVEGLRAEAAAITASTLHRRLPIPPSHDEVNRLARTMNEMLDRLEDASTRQRRFVSDASHELRSPVASIRTQLEVALRRGEQTDWPTVAQRVLHEDERLEAAVADLVTLARLDEAPRDASFVEVDLDELVLADAVRTRRVPVDTRQVSAGRVLGQPDLLTRVVRNLLDNAARHAATGVTVSLSTISSPGISSPGLSSPGGSIPGGATVRLVVDDDGPGIPVSDRERVFERFTRLDEGRSRDAGGMGLGLAVVRSAVERHHGSVVVDDAPGGGARLVVELPCA